MPLSIARLIQYSAAVLLVLAALLCGFMFQQISALGQISVDLDRQSQAILQASELRYNTAQIQQFYTDASLTLENDALMKGQESFQEAEKARAALEAKVPEFMSQLQSLKAALDGLNLSGRTMADTYRLKGKAAGDQSMELFDRQATNIIQAFGAFFDPLEARYQKLQAEAESIREGLLYKNFAAWIISLLVSMGTLKMLHHKVLSPIRRLRHSLENLASGKGDLSRKIDKVADDELGRVVDAFNQFVAHLAGQMNTVASVARSLDTASRSLVGDAQAAETSAEQLQAEVVQVATAVDEMASTVQQVAESAQSSAAETKDANVQSEMALKVVNTAIKDIQTLADEVEQASGVIQTLERHSQEIGSVLEVIRNIAEQTNLLALNAAIEAARAGEQGRGFAVVADEVRTLASRTQSSTQEIQSMIERLQSSAREAVGVMQTGREHAEHSVRQALEAGTSLQNIRDLIDSVSGKTLHIAEAAREQAGVTEEINRRINSVALVAEKNQKLAENTLNRGRSTEQDAQRLGGIVAQFNH